MYRTVRPDGASFFAAHGLHSRIQVYDNKEIRDKQGPTFPFFCQLAPDLDGVVTETTHKPVIPYGHGPDALLTLQHPFLLPARVERVIDPLHDGFVVATRQDFAIECRKGVYRFGVGLESLLTVPRVCIPHPDRAVDTCRDELLPRGAVAGEERPEGVLVGLNHVLAGPVLCVPDHDCGEVILADRRAGKQPATADSKAQHAAGLLVSVQGHFAAPSLCIPQLDGAVIGPGDESGLESADACDLVRMPVKNSNKVPCVDIPHHDRAVARSADQAASDHFKVGDGPRVVGDGALNGKGIRVPDANSHVPGTGHKSPVANRECRDGIRVALKSQALARPLLGPPAGAAPGRINTRGPPGSDESLVFEGLREQGFCRFRLHVWVRFDDLAEVAGVHQRKAYMGKKSVDVLHSWLRLVGNPTKDGREHSSLVAV
mmetsp:Transcript_4168/g.12307  ORF Transcript_4168/g.12307 Transcript_4168/m.12307 type:complete len:430 (-) Transcript_4168:664-1953(-)